MTRTRFSAILLLIVGVGIAGLVYYSQVNTKSSWYRPFKLGLDLRGGSQLTYEADTKALKPSEIADAMASLREVIDRRINSFGVSEPVIQVEEGSFTGGSQHRLIVELPGVTNIDEAVKLINATPQLEFKVARPAGPEQDAIIAAYKQAKAEQDAGKQITPNPLLLEDPQFISSGLTGRYLDKAQVEFTQNSLSPSVSISFNNEGGKLFAALTKANIGKPLAIYLDGAQISAPTVREQINDGKAVISGQFSVDQAKELARNLNLGALPVPIKLVSTQTIGATLGEVALNQGLKAGVIGFIVIVLFMLLWYRLPGLVAGVSLAIYVALMLAIFKLFSITLTAAGIAGLILSIGIAVDANVLIFERLKEELRRGKNIHEGILDGFGRAWTSIRDSNLSSVISAIILFWFGTSLIKGFALTLIIGIVVSLFTAITLTRTFLLAISPKHRGPLANFLFSNGLSH